MQLKTHWEQVYRDKGPEQVSWFQREAHVALHLIEERLPDRDARIVDAGGGASTLVDRLLDHGYRHVMVADIAAEAIRNSMRRLGPRAALVDWREGDITTLPLQPGAYRVWHDRALFHFLTDTTDRARYAAQVRHALAPGGVLIVATFAEDGPTRCSGLEVCRYTAAQLADEFGPSFQPEVSTREVHLTPRGTPQPFTWLVARFIGEDAP